MAISDVVDSHIIIYDGRGDDPKPLYTVQNLHRSIVHLMAFNDKYDCVVSCDESGMVEYWSPKAEREFEKPDNVFEYKSATGLFEFKKSKSIPTSLTISPTQESFSTFSHPDRQIRIFDFPSARLHRTYDESIPTLTTMQQAASIASKIPDLEFGRRVAIESDLSSPSTSSSSSSPLSTTTLSKANVIFDESGHFIVYGSLAGIKIINIVTNKVVRSLAKEETLRPLNIALYQGAPSKKSLVTVEMAASANPLLSEAESRDPMLFCTAHQKPRFYIFTNDSTASKSDRDIFNEKPTREAGAPEKAGSDAVKETGKAAIIHTTMGDVHVRLFPEAAPKTVENFVTHSRNGYYNGTIFHRVIRKFMIQGGDPLGDGTGGESIWGGEFEDEFSTLKHDKPYTLSMANAGPSMYSFPPGLVSFYGTDKKWQIRMGRSSLLPRRRRHGWTGSIRFSEGRSRGWTWLIKLRMLGRLRRSQRKILRSLIFRCCSGMGGALERVFFWEWMFNASMISWLIQKWHTYSKKHERRIKNYITENKSRI